MDALNICLKAVSLIPFGDVTHTWPSAPLRSPSPEDTDPPLNSRRGRENNASRHPGMEADVRTHNGNVGNTNRNTIRTQRWKFGNNITDIRIQIEILGENVKTTSVYHTVMLAAISQTPLGYCSQRLAAVCQTPPAYYMERLVMICRHHQNTALCGWQKIIMTQH